MSEVLPGLCSPRSDSTGPRPSVYGPDHDADRLHGVEAPAVLGPEDPVLVLAAVDATGVPHAVEVGLAAAVVPPASLLEVGAVTCRERPGSGQR